MKAEHIGLYSPDTDVLSTWYIEKLGFAVIETIKKEGRQTIYFIKGDEGLVIEILPTSAERVSRQLSDPGYSHIGLLVDDFDQAFANLQSAGVSVFDVRDTSTGWKIGYFDDIDGNRLEIVYRP